MDLAKLLIGRLFRDAIFSRTLLTEALDGSSEPYSNCLVSATTHHRLQPLLRGLKHIERDCGDSRQSRSVGVVNMDVDLLLYDDTRMHEADWERDYVKTLLQDFEA